MIGDVHFLFYIQHFFFSFWSSFAFSVIFNMPKEELHICGLSGAVGWVTLQTVMQMREDSLVLATFIGALLMAYFSRLMAFRRRKPITIYLIAGGIPLVPGYGVYYTMRALVDNDYVRAAKEGIETLKLSGVIVIGMILVFALPAFFFRPIETVRTWKFDRKKASIKAIFKRKELEVLEKFEEKDKKNK